MMRFGFTRDTSTFHFGREAMTEINFGLLQDTGWCGYGHHCWHWHGMHADSLAWSHSVLDV